MEDV
jgi:hypothetical protein